MQVIILTGGLGRRPKNIDNDWPVSMISIINKPFVEYILEDLSNNGIFNVIFALGYQGKIIEQYFGDGNKWKMKIQYVYEKELLGTVGVLKKACQLINGERVLVINGDTYCQLDYKQFIDFGKTLDVAIMLRNVENSSGYEGVLRAEKNVINYGEKALLSDSQLINGGIYCIKVLLLNEMPEENVSLENDIMSDWIKRKKKIGRMVSDGYFVDMAVPEDYKKFVADIQMRNQSQMKYVTQQLECLLEQSVTAASTSLTNWKYEMRLCLKQVYGVKSLQYEEFEKIDFEPESLVRTKDCREYMAHFCHKKLKYIKRRMKDAGFYARN